MRKTFIVFILIFCFTKNYSQLTFSVNNLSNSSSITCANPVVTLAAASNYTTAPVIYLWTTPSSSFIASNSIAITSGGVYTITATAGTLNAFQTISIGVNTVAPVGMVTPSTQNISCTTTPIPETITCISPTANITATVYNPIGGNVTSTINPFTYTPILVPGQYSVVFTDASNGCTSSATFSLFPSPSFPTFTLSSTPPGYTLGCSTKSCATFSITSPNSGPSISYTILPPNSSSVLPNGTLNPSSAFPICSAGTWTVVVRTNSTNCDVRAPFTILSNTAPPTVSLSYPTNTLSCFVPTIVITGTSNANASYLWMWPGFQLPSSSTLAIAPNPSVTAANTLITTYTFVATDNDNLCMSMTAVPMYQNLNRPNLLVPTSPINNCFPIYVPTVSIAGNTFTWLAQAGTILSTNSPTLQVFPYTYGSFTLIVQDTASGCETSGAYLFNLCEGLPSQFLSVIKIFPNPFAEELNLKNGLGNETQVIITDVSGREMKRFYFEKEIKINLSDLKIGIYFINVGNQNFKLLKE